jgi:tetratricopeptide (TPR) repeat protein
MLPLIMAAISAANAVASVLKTKASSEQDGQVIKRYEKVNAQLINNRDKLQKQYYELADRSKRQIDDLNLKLAESEMEKDLVYLALSLYHELMALREDIDINPSFEVLVKFHKAIIVTNYVLKQLNKHLVPVTQDYFSRILKRIDEKDNLTKEQLLDFISVLMNPQQDIVTSLLSEVQNEISHQQILESEEIINDDNNAQIWSQQGENFLDSKEYAQALICFDKAININPNNDEYWYWRARVLFSLDRYKEFIYSLDRAIVIAPENNKYRDWRSRVYCVN